MANPIVSETVVEDGPLKLHDIYHVQSTCDYNHELLLSKHQAQTIAARLRGIASISAVLIAEGHDLELSEWMRGGLIEAIHSLTDDMQGDLERINTRAQKAAKAAA